MSAFDDWLADNSKTRDTAAALDEITWLRLERQRLIAERKWIPVSERLPQPHFSVICFLNGQASEMQCTRHHDRLRWYYPASGEYDEGVTHWMPLPEPP